MILIGVCLLAVFTVRFRKERRRFGNGVLLLAGLLFTAGGLLTSGVEDYGPGIGVALLLLLSPLLIVILAGLLIWNGLVMLRREGTRIANALSLAAGVGLLAPYLGLVVAVVSGWKWELVALVSITLVASYLGFVLAVFVTYSLVYAWTTEPVGAAIVVHGSGLIGDRVPPLLAARLDLAGQLWAACRAAGADPLLVTSGGQGPDEAVSEATAMATYLRERGVPDERILREDRSVNTRENLRYSAQLLAEHAITGDIVLVTSNFHVLRTALLARSLDVDAHAVGAPTARYYLPSALLREYIAILAEHKIGNTVTCLVLAAIPIAVAIAT
ncbi:YdcF family protein [Nocardia sp. NPDC059177]|uniref:YdcF family protein n=1 Tax=Nocardia sp. NPDC059177 TaxID=3346759 RepID=UPI003698BC78